MTFSEILNGLTDGRCDVNTVKCQLAHTLALLIDKFEPGAVKSCVACGGRQIVKLPVLGTPYDTEYEQTYCKDCVKVGSTVFGSTLRLLPVGSVVTRHSNQLKLEKVSPSVWSADGKPVNVNSGLYTVTRIGVDGVTGDGYLVPANVKLPTLDEAVSGKRISVDWDIPIPALREILRHKEMIPVVRIIVESEGNLLKRGVSRWLAREIYDVYLEEFKGFFDDENASTAKRA